MKIGELSERTGIPTRMLRYYEQQELITPVRSENGYRSYSEDDVGRARQIRGLVQSGLTTRLAKVVLETQAACVSDARVSCSAELAQLLADELSALECRISSLSKSRDTVREFLTRAERDDLVET
ncbi:MerR family transcriptional regulator [Paramicrobacterium fandaimingii]|uniref:MerR family transcriptional regulator n=1 Tax=Paramicrobacterium fandaimingii TaxID=2708079 RepID=UPI00141E5379|nr:MerR family transcriptional regulator [Microbacterium fandaimingii]